jgi:putative membrane-bound dehydrogenase-like protein
MYRTALIFSLLGAPFLATLPAVGQQVAATVYQVGAAKRDITPTYPVRLHGFAFRRTESQGVTQPIWAKALVIDDGEPAVLLTVDTLGIPASLVEEVAGRLEKRLGLRRERLSIAATHTHTAPMVRGVAPTIFGRPIPPEHQQHIERYTAELTDHLEQVALRAWQERRPSRLFWGVGSVRFAVNRRTRGGPVDHDLPVLVVRDLEGRIRAIHVTYACHCVTLSHNKISGDWAGYAQELLETDHPGAIALVSIGCGGDANPSSGVTGDRLDLARGQGAEIAAEVRRLLGGFLAPVQGRLTAQRQVVTLPLADLPSLAQWQEKARRTDAVGYHAQVQLARLKRGEALRTQIAYPIQTWTFGTSLAWVFLPGEVVVDYSLRLKRELDRSRLWLIAYANDAPCYIPSERVLREGGYEGGGAMIYYDVPVPFRPGLEERIVAEVRRQLTPAFASPMDPKRTSGSAPLSPQQSWATLHVPADLEVELMAAEPLISSPVAIAFGPDGKLWVCEMYDYPTGVDGRYRPGGRIKLLEDTDGDGHYDKATVFLDNIPFPTGVTVWRQGVLVCAAPDILYAEDRDGDGRADQVRRLFQGFGTENYQARVNSLVYGLDGWVYGSCGLFGGTIHSFRGGPPVPLGNRDFRIRPDEGILEPATGRTQQGRVRDDWDNWFGCDNTTLARHYPLPEHYLRRNPYLTPLPPGVPITDDPEPNKLYPLRSQLQLFKLSGPAGYTTAACGLGVYRDELLGRQYAGNLFTCEPVNLILHRLVLTPKGSTFSGKRAPTEQTREFLASTDNWFRPVQVTTGPDGCLWVVDMYRYVIEHPRWIPAEDLARLDVRAGCTLGRLYRVRPRGRAPRPVPRLEAQAPQRLVQALSSPNGCLRDLAHQLLVWSGAGAQVADSLTALLHHSQPQTRLHALCLLGELHLLHPDDERLLGALDDEHPGVRRQAVRLSERYLRRSVPRLAKRVQDPDPQVRLQLALSLGEFPPSGLLARWLATLALDPRADAYLQAAVLSSLRPETAGDVLSQVLAADAVAPDFLRQLARITAALAPAQAVQVLQAQKVQSPTPASRQIALLTGLAEASAAAGPSGAALRGQLRCWLAAARTWATDEQRDLSQRLGAVELLGRLPEEQAAEVALLGRLLTPSQPPPIRAAALKALERSGAPQVPSLLLAAWDHSPPAQREQLVQVLLSRPAWTAALIQHLEKQPTAWAQLTPSQRQRLLHYPETPLRERVRRLEQGAIPSDRQQVLAAYRPALEKSGDAQRGQQVFLRLCASCHRWGAEGHAVGPDLATVQNRSPEYLLIAILDPNREVDPRYVEYLAVTRSGRTLSGLLAAETDASITLRGPQGQEETILRRDLEELHSLGRSLMPEGLEKDLSLQDLADLLALLRTPPAAAPSPAARSAAPSQPPAPAVPAAPAQQPPASSSTFPPLSLHPDNPHYFRFRGKPAILLTSGEHYGAVLNKDFDYIRYLDTLQRHGFNLTRTFSGTYREIPSSFGIEHNTLSPAPSSYLAPWARSQQPGAADGLPKFDLTRWDAAYFARLKDFVAQAGKRGIVVELTLFCTLYNDQLWAINPMNAANNINGVGRVGRREVYALKEAKLTEVQLAVARKLVRELRDFDNVYFEICNEPYVDGVTLAWQERILATLREEEKDLPHPHLLALNIANYQARIERPPLGASVFNFHYATPEAVTWNYALQKPLADDETGFRGIAPRPYRREAWNFLLSGGAVVSNLDYSFTVEHPDGTFVFRKSPGGGGPELRQQLAILKRFFESFDFLRLRPAPEVLRRVVFQEEPGAEKPAAPPAVRLLAEPGRQHALYLDGGAGAELTLDLPAGVYRLFWLHPRTGQQEGEKLLRHPGGPCLLRSPRYQEDLALCLKRAPER